MYGWIKTPTKSESLGWGFFCYTEPRVDPEKAMTQKCLQVKTRRLQQKSAISIQRTERVEAYVQTTAVLQPNTTEESVKLSPVENDKCLWRNHSLGLHKAQMHTLSSPYPCSNEVTLLLSGWASIRRAGTQDIHHHTVLRHNRLSSVPMEY